MAKLNWIPAACYGCEHAPRMGCEIYEDPLQHSRLGGCAMDTRKQRVIEPTRNVNPLKASKRQHKGLFNL